MIRYMVWYDIMYGMVWYSMVYGKVLYGTVRKPIG